MQEHDFDTAVLDAEATGPEPVTPTVAVTPLDYTQLRLLAEYTAVLEGDAEFVVTPHHALRVSTGPRDEDILIPAREEGKFPPMVVELYAEHDGILSEPLRLQPRCADAVFWSDAAVQKFLVPYVASCAGGDAVNALTRLRQAWNEFPPAVWVYALLHVVEYRDGDPLSLEHAIQVVYAEVPHAGKPGVELRRLPLGRFLDRYPPVKSPHGTPQPVSYFRGTDPSRYQRPDYRTLRAAAEYACSLSHGQKYFTFREGEKGFHPEPGLPVLGAGDFVIPVFTPSVPVHRPALHQVTCCLGNTQPDVVAPDADALFWSDAAVEQFLYPYYASKSGLSQGVVQLFLLSVLWTGRLPDLWPADEPVLASDPPVLYNARARVKPGALAPDPRVVGLVHMPTSEWIPEIDRGEASSALDDVGVVFAHQGRTRTLPAARFRALHRTEG